MTQPTPDEIARRYDSGEVVYVDARATDYVLEVVEPDPNWSVVYRDRAAAIRAALGDAAIDLQHVGSTSVPELPAKPIIDIDLTVPAPVDEERYVPALRALGYVHWLTEPDWHQHRLLKHLDEPRVHLHVFGPGCPEVVRHRMFRDWLLMHPEDRELYADTKRSAAQDLAETREDNGALGYGMRYNRLKEPVVLEIYERMFRAAGFIPLAD